MWQKRWRSNWGNHSYNNQKQNKNPVCVGYWPSYSVCHQIAYLSQIKCCCESSTLIWKTLGHLPHFNFVWRVSWGPSTLWNPILLLGKFYQLAISTLHCHNFCTRKRWSVSMILTWVNKFLYKMFCLCLLIFHKKP